jgi:hypothetical protein
MQRFEIDGIVPVVPTPFTAGEEIHWDSLGRPLDFAVKAGACAVCLPAYASEFYKLGEEERDRLLAEAVGRAGPALPVVAQVNHSSAERGPSVPRPIRRSVRPRSRWLCRACFRWPSGTSAGTSTAF